MKMMKKRGVILVLTKMMIGDIYRAEKVYRMIYLIFWEDVSYFMLTLIPFTPKFSCSISLVELHRLITLDALPAFRLFVPTWKYFAMEGIFEK